MTDHHPSTEPREPDRPSWLTEPCPGWCAREHHEDDHPEDRIHQDDGVVIAAIVGDRDLDTLRPVPRAAELVVRRLQHVSAPALTWLSIEETEGSRVRLLMTEHSAAGLRAALPDPCRPPRTPEG